ncbi:biopolymer transporter ExbD [Candidatus Poribacteria bacterium]|jgi:biopolymer transport protein ExbD|nr:biopolymer transporter ExbD [Candidatus Poribacteria bacterium]MBT5536854.1 biopolymer transporter ExbD [Candidatus Poribacteria bacterium]MBT5713300.1 biopolymer transporter ExbD [Candidatus Poribacteria bacterium]MBT7099426.1 biopolymer transporter ExbD [Candidatus Poribacteria bacterium]MBT7804288.1 biopolymer transporter ExbD [Candidatus Poribacteria bacterium]
MQTHTHEEQMVTERSERRAPNVDMTPMIDCVFLLIIFFMLATTFAPLPGIRVKLPPPGQPSREKPKGLILRISNPVGGSDEGVMILNNEIVSLDNAFGVFMNAAPEAKDMLIIQAGRQVVHDQIIKIMDRAKRAGVVKIGFAMVQ